MVFLNYNEHHTVHLSSVSIIFLSLKPLNDTIKVPDSTDQSELMKAISFLVDHCHLFTTHIMVQIIMKVN